PALNAVAWWDTGTYGHVAIVGRVINNDTIILEEYNKAGTGVYASRQVTRGSSAWPKKFLHIADQGGGGGTTYLDINTVADGQVVATDQNFFYAKVGGVMWHTG